MTNWQTIDNRTPEEKAKAREEMELWRSKLAVYTAGSIIILEMGEYSDRGVVGLGRVLKDFTEADLPHEWQHRGSYNPSWGPAITVTTTVKWMVDQGFIEEVAYQGEINIGR